MRMRRSLGFSARQLRRRVYASAKAASLGDMLTGHSGRVGMAQDPVESGVELLALMTAGRWKSSKDAGALGRVLGGGPGAVAGYYYDRGVKYLKRVN